MIPLVSLTIGYLIFDDSLSNKKVWGLPYLKIEKLQEILFMCFDRYEIHIQAFVDFIS